MAFQGAICLFQLRNLIVLEEIRNPKNQGFRFTLENFPKFKVNGALW